MSSLQSGSQKFTMIYYYVPEDQDDPEVPNAFGVNYSLDEVRVHHIRKAFPMEGEYYYRFKFKMGNSVVWMDLNSEDCKLPLFNGRIFVKATRISWENRKKSSLPQNVSSYSAPHKDLDLDGNKASLLTGQPAYQGALAQPEISKFGSSGLVSNPQIQQQQPQIFNSSIQLEQQLQQQQQYTKAQNLSSLESNLLEFDHIFPEENLKKKKPKDQSDLLDF